MRTRSYMIRDKVKRNTGMHFESMNNTAPKVLKEQCAGFTGINRQMWSLHNHLY